MIRIYEPLKHWWTRDHSIRITIRIYEPLKHWWTRNHSIQITIWPTWLAQLLCKHKEVVINGLSFNNQEFQRSLGTCCECQKHVYFNEKYEIGTIIKKKEYYIDHNFWGWEYPNYTKTYIVSADVSRGDGTDYSSCQVLDVDNCGNDKEKLDG